MDHCWRHYNVFSHFLCEWKVLCQLAAVAIATFVTTQFGGQELIAPKQDHGGSLRRSSSARYGHYVKAVLESCSKYMSGSDTIRYIDATSMWIVQWCPVVTSRSESSKNAPDQERKAVQCGSRQTSQSDRHGEGSRNEANCVYVLVQR